MSGDPLDLDAIESRAKEPDCRLPSGARPMRCADSDIHPDAIFHCPECREARTTLALVAEVRRLRAQVEGRTLEQDALSNALPILADAADVADAWNVAGRAPAHHRSMQARLRQAWPTLARAVESLASR